MSNNQSNMTHDSKGKKKDRIASIDIFKGLSIIIMVCGHTMNFWVVEGGIWMYSIMYLYICSILTSVNFVMLSGMTIPISYLSKIDSGWSIKRTMIHTLKRASVLLIISLIYNIIIGTILGSFAWNNIWTYYSWYVLQLIAISIILTLFMMPLNKYIRLAIGVTFILIATPLYTWLGSVGTPTSNFIINIFFNPFEDFPFFPWSGLVIIGSVIGEIFYGVYKSPPEIRQKKLKNFMLYLALIGLALLAFGLISGLGYPAAADEYWHWYSTYNAANLSTNPFLTIYALPYFMLVGHWTYMFYGLGVLFIIFASFIWLADYKKYKNWFFDFLTFVGVLAFSIFLYHHIGIPLLIHKIPVFWIWPVCVAYTLIVPLIVWLDVKYLKGIGTLEWIMIIVTSTKKLKKNSK